MIKNQRFNGLFDVCSNSSKKTMQVNEEATIICVQYK